MGPQGTVSRRRALRLLGLGVAAVGVAACSAPASPAAPPAKEKAAPGAAGVPAATAQPAQAAPKTKQAVTLRLWHWDTFLVEPYEKEAAEYAKLNPHVTIKVEHTASNEYPQKLTASVAGGVPPDIIGVTVTRADFLLFATKGQLTPLQTFIDRDKYDVSDFYPLNLKQHSWKGTLFSLPYAWNTMIWFYNENLVSKAGVKTPTQHWREGTWNWDTYKQLATSLTTGSGMDKQWGTSILMPTTTPNIPAGTASFLPLVWSNGGDWFDSTVSKSALMEPATFEAYQFAYDMRQYSPGLDDAQTGTIESGRLGMWPNWDIWYLLNRDMVPFEYSIVPPPASPKTNSHFFTGNAPGFGIPKGAKYADESWEFIKFLLTTESMSRLFLAANNTPSRISLAGSNDLWDKNPKLRDPKLMAEIAKGKEKTAKNPAKISNYAELTKAHSEEMSLVWAGSQPLDVGVKKVAEQWDRLLKEGQVDPDAN